MGKQNRTTLKNYFQTGKVPTQGNYADLIDSFVNLEDSDPQLISGGISSSHLDIGAHLGGHITASGNISASGYITASQLFGNISASYVVMPFLTDLKVNANITSSGNLGIVGSASFGGDITASSSHISCSKLSAEIGHFKKIKGFSPITIEDPVNFTSGSVTFTHGVTASGDFQVGGTIFGSIGSTASDTITQLGKQTLLNVDGPMKLTGSMHLVPSGPLTITGSISASGHITTEGNISAAKLTAPAVSFTSITGSVSGSLTGKITASGLSLEGTDIEVTGTEINRLKGVLSNVKEAYDTVAYNATSGQLTFTELDNGTDVINLGVGTNSSPTFSGLTLNKTTKGSIGVYGGTINAGDGNSFVFTLTGIPEIQRKDSGKPSKSTPTFITSTQTTTTSIILITCLTHQLSAIAFGNATEEAEAESGFFISLTNERSDANFTAGTATFSCVIL